MGVSVVNALSRELEVSVWRGGARHWQRFARGVAQTELQQEEEAAGDAGRKGTEVRFLYDDTIFSKT